MSSACEINNSLVKRRPLRTVSAQQLCSLNVSSIINVRTNDLPVNFIDIVVKSNRGGEKTLVKVCFYQQINY